MIRKWIRIGYPKENALSTILGHTGWYFPKLILNHKISCLTTSIKKTRNKKAKIS